MHGTRLSRVVTPPRIMHRKSHKILKGNLDCFSRVTVIERSKSLFIV